MSEISKKSLCFFRYAFESNYYVSLLVTLVCAVMSMAGNQSMFDMNGDLYGPLANNLRLMMLYLVFAEFSIFLYCFKKGSYKELTVLGLFLILLIGALEFYGRINNLPIDEKYHLFFLYTGFSHIFYGILSSISIDDSREKIS